MGTQHIERDWIFRISRLKTQRAVYTTEFFAGVEPVLLRQLGYQRPGLLLFCDCGEFQQYTERRFERSLRHDPRELISALLGTGGARALRRNRLIARLRRFSREFRRRGRGLALRLKAPRSSLAIQYPLAG
jgi:hypothetical protein